MLIKHLKYLLCLALVGCSVATLQPRGSAPPPVPEKYTDLNNKSVILSPMQTLNEDVLGPVISLEGTISRVLLDRNYTCFVLDQILPYSNTSLQRAEFLTCAMGIFSGQNFQIGSILSVTGNLGSAQERKIGNEIFNLSLIAAPNFKPIAFSSNESEYPYSEYPYYPRGFYDPYYWGWGIGYPLLWPNHHWSHHHYHHHWR